VNNAGIYIGKPFTTHTAEDFAAVVNVNMAGFYYITQLATAEMEKHSSGHVVSVTSSAVDAAISGVYSVLAALTKGGLNAATKSLAIAYAKKGIRVNSFAQGIIKTPMHAPETHEALGAFHPLGRMGEMSDIADAILFLDSAPFITGEILHVDGGQSAGHQNPSGTANRCPFPSLQEIHHHHPLTSTRYPLTGSALRPRDPCFFVQPQVSR
jgi:NAD(P)-dependent dehydrogenase (short-subunit alcohol dehydrogenase family)